MTLGRSAVVSQRSTRPFEVFEESTNMAFSVEMPALGESVTEGTVTRWLKQEGDTVERDEPLLEVSTDKVDTEIPAPASGVLSKIIAQEDDTVEVGGTLAEISEDGESGGDKQPAEVDTAEEKEKPAEEPAAQPEPAAEETEAPKPEPSGGGTSTPVLMPELGESVAEGTVTRWLKKVGEKVEQDEPLVEVSTDKVDTEIPSPVSGTLLSITAEEDDTVAVGGELAKIGEPGGAAAGAKEPEPKEEPREEAIAAPKEEPKPEPSKPEPKEEPKEAPQPAAGEKETKEPA